MEWLDWTLIPFAVVMMAIHVWYTRRRDATLRRIAEAEAKLVQWRTDG